MSYEVQRFAGTSTTGNQNGHRLTSTFSTILGLCFDKSGNLFVADHGNNSIRVIRGDQVETLITNKFGDQGRPCGICFGEDRNLHITDYNNRILTASVEGEVIQTVELNGKNHEHPYPAGILEIEPGTFYFACRILDELGKVNKEGDVSTVISDLQGPWGIARDTSGNIYVSEFVGNCIRRMDKRGNVTPFVAIGEVEGPTGIVFDLFGNLLVCEYNNGNIKRISPDGKISTLSFVDEEGKPFAFFQPIDMVVDATGIYVAEHTKGLITKIKILGNWSTSLHSKFPPEIRNRIKAVMMLVLRKGNSDSYIWRLPKDILFLIFAVVVTLQ